MDAYYSVLTRNPGTGLKKIVTFRFDADLLAKARDSAQRENRTLTNFVETVLKQAVDGAAADGDRGAATDSGAPA